MCLRIDDVDLALMRACVEEMGLLMKEDGDKQPYSQD
jgi:hypothetical protein